MIKTVEEFLSRIAQATSVAPRPTWDGWQARCPAHDDRHASLSVSRGAAGRILLKCHAGCETSAVVAAIGWRLDDLTPPAERPDFLSTKNERPPIQGEPALTPVVSRLCDCEPTTVRWLWPGRIPLGKLTLLVGDPGLGKSFVTLDLAARITRGAALPALDGDAVAESENQRASNATDPLAPHTSPLAPGSVVLLSAEDDANDTICPRFLAAGGVPSRITVLHAVACRDASSGQTRETHCSLATDLNVLEEVIRSLGDCRLVVIDPITAYLGTSDSHNNAEMRSLLAPISALAARTGVALVAINHLNKTNQGPAIYRSMGSVAFAATARSALAVLADSYELAARLLVPIKSNLACAAVGMRYRIVSRAGDEQPVIQWDTMPVRMTADELLAAAAQSAAAGGATLEAADWLTEMLRGGPQPAAELKTLAKSDGIHERTLLRAKARLGLVMRRTGVGLAGTWLWQWPADRPLPSPQPSSA